MLLLKDITKVYETGDNAVHALNGVSLAFRHNEFVSILGQSGCGKTTLLNLVGGLDRYTTGDLIINGKSTKRFKDRDWDTYRNHTIGFVFQSYNLIPHQSVLSNVELALTLSGVSKKERRRRAKEALVRVGLGDQLRKKPSQLSGGQMQRVAIARALVNDPDIILADEPTGALDTETSVQVMEILKEVAGDRLVVMVTHNPELAEQYSTRIIRMLDGKITDDSAPLTEEELAAEQALEQEKANPKGKKRRQRKPSMSFFTAFGLSLKNLFTKKGRTALTSFAGSIGIIGIALIAAVSNGMTTYINTVQEDTLSSYPLTLEATHMDMGTLLTTFIGEAQSHGTHDKDAVYQKTMFYDLVNALNTMEGNENDLKAFKKYLEKEMKDAESPLSPAVNGIQYTYDLNMLIYTKNIDGDIIQSDSQQLLEDLLLEYFGMDMSGMTSMGASYGMPTTMMMPGMSAVTWQEMLSGEDGDLINPLLKKQYDVIYGSWPNDYNEVMLVVDGNNEVDDMTLYALGLKSKDDIDKLAHAAIDKNTVEHKQESWSYKDICGMEFRTVFAADCYKEDPKTGLYTDLRDTQAGMKYLYDNGTSIKVCGILRPNEDAASSMLTGSIVYTKALTEYVIDHAEDSPAVKAQKKDKGNDIFTGLPFKDNSDMTAKKKAAAFRDHVEGLEEADKAETYLKIMSIPSDKQLQDMVDTAMKDVDRDKMQETLVTVLSQQTGMDAEEMTAYLDKMTDEDIEETYTEMVTEQSKMQYAMGVRQQMAAVPAPQMAMMLDAAMEEYSTKELAKYYDEVLEFSESTYEDNLIELGCVDPEDPASINIYASSFENKDVIEEVIADYNEGKEELERITYTDYVGLMMSSITTIIDAITYVLIAFVAISLIVSSIMIGVITLISVQERTKEIGILRAIGASKRNVSSMFNAETVIIGFSSGLLGVGITYALCIPINIILHNLTDIQNLNAILPPQAAVILVVISVVLTLFAGIIPSRSAAKKDPVVALRTE